MSPAPDENDPQERDEGADEAALDEDEQDPEDEDEEPRVLLATMASLGARLPEGLRKGFAARPIWFLRQDDEELVTVFEQLPEDPMPKGRAHELLRVLRVFAEDMSDELQRLLGVTDALVYGFHGDASLDQVTSAFEEDGFFVFAGVLQGGAIVTPEG